MHAPHNHMSNAYSKLDLLSMHHPIILTPSCALITWNLDIINSICSSIFLFSEAFWWPQINQPIANNPILHESSIDPKPAKINSNMILESTFSHLQSTITKIITMNSGLRCWKSLNLSMEKKFQQTPHILSQLSAYLIINFISHSIYHHQYVFFQGKINKQVKIYIKLTKVLKPI